MLQEENEKINKKKKKKKIKIKGKIVKQLISVQKEREKSIF